MSEVPTRLQSQKRSWAHPGSAHDRLIRLSLIFLPVGIGEAFSSPMVLVA